MPTSRTTEYPASLGASRAGGIFFAHSFSCLEIKWFVIGLCLILGTAFLDSHRIQTFAAASSDGAISILGGGTSPAFGQRITPPRKSPEQFLGARRSIFSSTSDRPHWALYEPISKRGRCASALAARSAHSVRAVGGRDCVANVTEADRGRFEPGRYAARAPACAVGMAFLKGDSQ